MPKVWLPAHSAKLRRLWRNGVLLKNICAEVGFTEWTILRKRKALGLKPRNKFGKSRGRDYATLYFNPVLFERLQTAAQAAQVTVPIFVTHIVAQELRRLRDGKAREARSRGDGDTGNPTTYSDGTAAEDCKTTETAERLD